MPTGEIVVYGESYDVSGPNINLIVFPGNMRVLDGGTLDIGAGLTTDSDSGNFELAGTDARLIGTGVLSNGASLSGAGRVETEVQNLSGGTINATLDDLTFTQPVTNDAGGRVNAIVSTLNFDSGLTNQGDVNLIDSTINGDAVNNGVASLAGTNTFTGTVSGSGTFTGTGVALFTGTLAPGESPGLLTFEGDLDLEPTATLKIEIAGTTPGVEHDRVEVGGFATLEGALDVTLLDGFVPEPGDSFAFLFASGAFDASFAAINLPDLSAEGLAWELNPGGSTLFLEAVPALDGDYNLDGTVNASDYTVWRDGLGTTFTPSDYDVWVANFGATAPAFSASVPEAATGVLLFGCLGCRALRLR